MNYKSTLHYGTLLSGTHVCHEDKHQFTVCLDAAYYDTVVDSYLIEFKTRESGYIINRHSLPEFIPTLQLEKEHLPHGDLSTFLSVLKNYLQAFVFKKEEVEKVKVRVLRANSILLQIIYFRSKSGRPYSVNHK